MSTFDQTAPPTPGPALRVRNLTKSFGEVEVLHNIELDVPPGEVHGLLGQNGSGKSTLVKILTGVYGPDGGELHVHGKAVDMPVARPLRHGISVIHQDIGLADDLSVFDNVGATVGFGVHGLMPIPSRREQRLITTIADSLGLGLDLSRRVGELTAAERTFVGVLRALRALEGIPADRRILILDEPTTSLPAPDALQITGLMQQLARAGSSVIFISHRLGEVLQVCNSATILRSGSVVHSGSLSDVRAEQLTERILGRRMEAFYPAPPAPSSTTTVMRVRHLSGNRLQEMSFDLHASEVLGVTGLMGMGQEELPALLSGDAAPSGGRVVLGDGSPLARSVKGAIMQGVVRVPANRGRDGVWLLASARENVTLPHLGRYQRRIGLHLHREREDVDSWIKRLSVTPQDAEQPLGAFSGGNQQKLVVAKWLDAHPTVLVLDEPTQGVDAGAKHELLEALLDRACAGAGIVLVSGDHDQLAHVCTRVLVLHEGRLVREVSGEELTEERLMHFCNNFDGVSSPS